VPAMSAAAGDVPTMEVLAAISILRQQVPDLKIRMINVVDLMRLAPDTNTLLSVADHCLRSRDFVNFASLPRWRLA
jgi:phosphoketolase